MTKTTLRAAFLVAALAGWSRVAQPANSTAPTEERTVDTELRGGESRQRQAGDPVASRATNADKTLAQGTEDGMPQAEVDNLRGHRPSFHRRWYLGVHAYNTPTGVYVTAVAPQSPARRAGLEPGDTIVTVNGYQVGVVNGTVYYLSEEMQRLADQSGRVCLLVHNWRNGRLLNVDVSLLPGPRTRPRAAGLDPAHP